MAAKKGDCNKKTILVIEDEADLRQFETWALEAAGFAVLQAADAETGMQLLRGSETDLVLLDLRLPDRSGWTILEEIKADAKLAATAVVFVTASADIKHRGKALEMGAAEYLIKPVTAKGLAKHIEKILAAQQG